MTLFYAWVKTTPSNSSSVVVLKLFFHIFPELCSHFLSPILPQIQNNKQLSSITCLGKTIKLFQHSKVTLKMAQID